MTEDVIKKLEVTAYTAVIIASVLVTAVAIHNYEATRPRSASPKPAYLSISGTDWKTNHRTLVLALSTSCHFCRDSAEFYKTLTTERQVTDRVHIVAVVPQATKEGQAFLRDLGVEDIEVKHATLHEIGVDTTPTLLLVDESGRVVDSWIGKLTAEQEAAIIVHLKRAS